METAKSAAAAADRRVAWSRGAYQKSKISLNCQWLCLRTREQTLSRRACTQTHVHTGISHAREREGSSQQPASNRGKKKHTTNLSKQLFIRVFNAKDKNKNKSCPIESRVVVRWRAPLCLELDPYSLRATSYDLLTRWHNISKVCVGYVKFGKWFALSFYLLHMNRSNVGKTER